MRLFLYIYYFIRSVYYRGLAGTISLLKAEGHYEKVFGIRSMSIKKSNDPNNFHYQGAGYKVLLDLFPKLPPHLKEKTFIDYGSGKGRALFCAEFCGFNDLLGVELDENLVHLANENITTYTKKRQESKILFIHQNALEFEIPGTARTFFFFNPFSDLIMNKVAEKITEHRKKINEEVYIIYMNPTYKKLWEKHGFKILFEQRTKRYLEAVVYKM
jgi:predicted RNA methylase